MARPGVERWREAGFSANAARGWLKAGFSPTDALRWRTGNIFSHRRPKMAACRHRTRSSEEMGRQQFRGGRRPCFGSALPSRPRRPSNGDASVWTHTSRGDGVAPATGSVTAERWVQQGFHLDAARRWRDIGFTPDQAAGCASERCDTRDRRRMETCRSPSQGRGCMAGSRIFSPERGPVGGRSASECCRPVP